MPFIPNLLNVGQRMQGMQSQNLGDLLQLGQQAAQARGRMMLGDLMRAGSQDYNQLGAVMSQAAGPVEGMNVYDPTQRAYKESLTNRMNQKVVGGGDSVKPLTSEQIKSSARLMGTSVDDMDWKEKRVRAVSMFPQIDSIIPADYSEQNKADMIKMAEGLFAEAREGREGQKMGLAVNADTRAEAAGKRAEEEAGMKRELFPHQLKKAEIDVLRAEKDSTNLDMERAIRVAQLYKADLTTANNKIEQISYMRSLLNQIPAGKPLTGPEAEAVVTQWKKVLDPTSAVMQGEFDSVINNTPGVDKLRSTANSWVEGITLQPDFIAGVKKAIGQIAKEAQRQNGNTIQKARKFGERYGINPAGIPLNSIQELKESTDIGGGMTMEDAE